MDDDFRSIVAAKQAIVTQNPIHLPEVRINYQITTGIPCAIILNNCAVGALYNEPIKTGRSGLFLQTTHS